MPFCKFSIDMLANSTTSVDNIFINNYLPYADAEFVKIYLYGLYKCQDASARDNTLERFAAELHQSAETIEKAFEYWQEKGLVQILNVLPFEVRYLPISDVINNTKRYNEKKYANFNAQAQEILHGRMITPNEYREYYDIIERLHMEREALLLVIDYCVKAKGDNVGYAYITTVAKNWIGQGLTTAQQIKDKVLEIDTLNSGMEGLVKVLALKRAFSLDEYEYYKKWVVAFGFDEQVITYVAKKCKNKFKNIFEGMDKLLETYFSQKLFTQSDIETFEAQRAASKQIALSLCKNLGLYYENLDPVVETYVLPWLNLGFSESMLTQIATYCFKSNIRTLEGMDKVLQKFHKLGILTEQSLNEYFAEVLSVDKKIKELLEKLGLSRNVNQYDRDKYKIWTQIWNMPDDMIEYAASQALGKEQPMQYLSSILSAYHDKKVRTLQDAKENSNFATQNGGKAKTKPANNKQDALNKATRIILQRKMDAEEKFRKLTEALNKDEKFVKLQQEHTKLMIENAKNFSQGQKTNSEEEKKLQKQIDEIRKSYGVQISEPQYFCPHCKDSGYVNGQMCSCLKKELENQIKLQEQSKNEGINALFQSLKEVEI